MTAIGIVVAVLALLLLLRAPARLWELAILITPFQASTFIDISTSAKDSGLAPVYLVLGLACMCELWHWLGQRALPQTILRNSLPALCFLGWGVLSACLIPVCFAGWLLVAPYSVYTISRLDPSFSNLTHCLYLSLLIAAMILLALHIYRKGEARLRSLRKAFEAAVWLAAGIIVWHHLSLYLGLPYPNEFLYNNAGVVHYEGTGIRPELSLASGLLRASGPFSESAIAAGYLGGGFGFTLAECIYGARSKWSLLKCSLLGMILLSVISTSSFVILGATSIFYLAAALRAKRRQIVTRVALVLAILLAVPLSIALLSPQAREEADLALNYLVLNKFDPMTDRSPRSRTVIEKNALAVLWSSDGLGSGLGSNVAFTMQGYIASNTGVVGIGLCAWFAIRMRKLYRRGLKRRATGDRTIADWRKLGGAVLGMIIGGLAGSHPLAFLPIWYLVLAMVIGGSGPMARRAASLPARPSIADASPVAPEFC